MNTSDMINAFLEEGVIAYKRNSKNSLEARKLNRHETIIVHGQEFNCWREYVVYRMAEYIAEKMPELNREDIEVTLDGNDSTITVALSDQEQQKLNRIMYLFLKEVGCV